MHILFNNFLCFRTERLRKQDFPGSTCDLSHALFSLPRTWMVRDPRNQNISRLCLEDSQCRHVCKIRIMWNAAVSELWALGCQITAVLYSVHDISSGQHNCCIQYTNSQHRSFWCFRKSIALFLVTATLDEDGYGALLECYWQGKLMYWEKNLYQCHLSTIILTPKDAGSRRSLQSQTAATNSRAHGRGVQPYS